ncbi:TetR/AcrR family transcriptional regulator [Streptomyces sp. TLI_105]|uniref:TetR/AcrR family transcriptional regulator n=1 Tax=Streptomyces sp. TLI_105 TaxID=1881019 RepID=UPI0008987C94|nr:TetR family transcriptional regulator [Streptomyces sp. TLI_105]SED64113.1 transcriptional regulator, TetR family [Streptomyces sp. TLI_105]
MTRARRHDPGRRERIVDAALAVVGRAGIAGLSHRTVAVEADVPLGSTTYHFASLDELLVAALRRVNGTFGARLRQGPELDAPDLAAGLAALMGEWLGAEPTGVELEYELYLAALRRPALRPVAAEWADEVVAALAPRTGPVTARALVALMDGISLQVLLTGAPYDEGYAREMLARLLNEDPKRQAGTSSEPPTDPTDT